MSQEDYFYNSPAKIKRYETLQISHPSFSQVYRVVRNSGLSGLTATIEDFSQQFFQYCPMQITKQGQKGNLDQSIAISFGDLGEILPQEIDRVINASTNLTYPVVVYRQWRSDNLKAVFDGPEYYQIDTIAFKKEGSTFEIVAPKLNVSGSGIIYTSNNFPGLGGFQ